MFPEITFSDYVLRQATNAGVFLGQRENPLTGEKTVNLKAAHGALNVLQILKSKTGGNLTTDEQTLLDDTLKTVETLFEQAKALEP